MNFKLYIFGESSGYKQYPDDSISFKEYYKNQHSSSLLNIKRKADLVYYVYTQKIDKDKESYLGFCLVFNGVYIKQTKGAFTLFEKAYSDCILGGKLFKIEQNGKIAFATDDFGSQKDEFDRIVAQFNEELERKSKTFFSLLPKTYKYGQGCKAFAISDSAEIIGEAISTYDSISIPNDNCNEDLDYVGKMIKDLYDENQTLKSNYAALNKQKKQYRWVAILSIAVIASLIGLYFLNDNLSGIISNQDSKINRLENTIADKDMHISSLQDTLSNERSVIKKRNNEIQVLNTNLNVYKDSLRISENHKSELESELSKSQSSLRVAEAKFSSLKNTFPINITNIEIGNSYKGGNLETDYGYTIYSKNTMYLKPKISYIGINTGRSINLKIKWYRPNGTLSTGDSSPSGFSQQSSLYVYSGSNTATLSGWGNEDKGHWDKGTYRIEVWYENVCLKSKTFRIY